MATKKSDSKKPVAVGTALVAAVAAAGMVFLYGTKNAVKNRKKVKGWVLKAKGEVLDKIEDAKELHEEKYEEIVDSVGKKYSKLKKVESKEVDAFVKEMKKHWKEIKGEFVQVLDKEQKKIRTAAAKKIAPKKATQVRKTVSKKK